MNQLLNQSDNAADGTYAEDFLLTYRAFDNDPQKICKKLLEWFEQPDFRDKVNDKLFLRLFIYTQVETI